MNILFFLLAWSLSVLACEVTLPHHLVVLGEGQLNQNTFTQKNCSEQFLTSLHSTLQDIDGRISSAQLSEMVNSRGDHGAFTINPHLIQVQQLRNIIREQLLLPAGVQVKGTRGVNVTNILPLAAGDRLDVSCTGCLYGTEQPVNLMVRGFDGSERAIVAVVDFKKMVRAYRVLSFLNSFSEISPEMLKEEYVEAVPHTDLVTNLETLRFYKSNKPLKNGDLLRYSDLNAMNLVKAGLKTEVIIESQVIRIKTQGISRNNGALGEVVEVFHPQKNKKYQGKVIDINKVLVEL